MEIVNSMIGNKRQRLVWIDVLKFLAIFLVLWGHCIQHLTTPDFSSNQVFQFIYSFHMPLFMILSGFFAHKLAERSFREVFVSKFLQLLLPTIVFGIVYWLQSRYLFHQTSKSLMQALYYYSWFLKSLFVCIIMFHIGLKMSKQWYLGLIVMLILSQLIDFFPHFRFLQLRYMFPCFVFGYMFFNLKDYFYQYYKIITAISTVCFVLLLWHFNTALLYPDVNINLISQMGVGKIVYLLYYKLLIGFAGSITFMGVIFALSRKLDCNKVFLKIADFGRYTLAIYILQSFLLESWLKYFFNYTMLPFRDYFFLLYAPIISAIILALCIIICHGCDKAELSWLFDYNKLWKLKSSKCQS